MDIIEWVFRKRPWEKHLPEINSLMDSIRKDVRLFNRLIEAHQQKLAVIKQIDEGNLSLLKRIPSLNEEILDSYDRILNSRDFIRALIKKILYESAERLHEIEGWVWRYGRENSPTWNETTSEMIGPKGRRAPYNIENSKRAVWAIVQDKTKLDDFVNRAERELQTQLADLSKFYEQLKTFLEKQSANAKAGIWSGFGLEINETLWAQENALIMDLRKTLSEITNKILLLAKDITGIEIDEQNIVNQIKQHEENKKVGVMLIHGITCKPTDMNEFDNFLRSKGFITYNIRLPGHGHTLEEFFNTPVNEIENFLVSAFKYFYQYMASVNEGDGKFYIAGISIGAMMPLHIMAKSWQGKYPYQSMVKGMISMSACIIPKALGSLRRLEPIITGFGPTLYKIITFFSKKGLIIRTSDVDKKVNEIRKRNLTPEEFEEAVRREISPLIMSKIREQKKRFLSHGDLYMYSDEEEQTFVENLMGFILNNLRNGKRALTVGDINDFRTAVTRDKNPGNSFKTIGELAGLTMALRTDMKNIRIPILIMQGLLDTVVHRSSADYIYDNVKTNSKFKERIFLKKSGHVPVLDFDKETVFQKSFEFIEKVEMAEIAKIEQVA